MIIIPSVPHSGTMYTVKLFTACGYRHKSLVDPEVPDNSVRVGHIVKEGQFNTADLKWTDMEPDDDIREFADEMSGFLTQFYR